MVWLSRNGKRQRSLLMLYGWVETTVWKYPRALARQSGYYRCRYGRVVLLAEVLGLSPSYNAGAWLSGVACDRTKVGMRVRLLVVTACVVLVAAAVASVVLLGHGRHETPPSVRAASHAGPPTPAGALSAVRLLVSDKGRKALAPALAAVLPTGRPFPAGTTFSVLAGSWQQTGIYANTTGTLREPGHAPVRAEIGLVERSGRWLVTFEATL
jgi:hypothetical protein